MCGRPPALPQQQLALQAEQQHSFISPPGGCGCFGLAVRGQPVQSQALSLGLYSGRGAAKALGLLYAVSDLVTAKLALSQACSCQESQAPTRS